MRRLPAADHDAVTSRRRELKVLFPRADPGKIARVLELNVEPVRFGQHEVSEVHSIYFDDARLSACAESMAGVEHRVKLRVRWYDEPLPTRMLFFELKRRSGRLCSKERTPFELSAPLADRPYAALVDTLLAQLDDEPSAWLGLRGEPTMLVSYRRRHFRDRETGARLTLDWGLHGFDQLGARTPRRRWSVASDGRVLVELKVPPGAEEDARHLLAPLRARISRSSKYVHCCSHAGWFQLPEAFD